MEDQVHTTGPDTAQEIEAVRARIRRIIEGEGLSQARIADKSGVSPATVSAFLLGNYAGDNLRIARELAKWADGRATRAALEPVRERLRQFAETPVARRVLDALAFGKAGEMVMVCGGSGVGKTTAARRFQDTHTNVWICQITPSMRSVPATLRAIGAAIGLHGMPRDGSAVMNAICQRVERAAGLLVLDEAQHLTDDGFEQVQALWDRGHVGVAFVGHAELALRIRRLEHVAGRVSVSVSEPRAGADDVRALLRSAGIEDPRSFALLGKSLGKKGLRPIVHTVRDALYLAAADGASAIEFDHIECAWTHLSGRAAV